MGTEFTMYDDGTNPETIQDASMNSLRTNIRQELGAVFYVGGVGSVANSSAEGCLQKSNIMGTRGPRKMEVLVPTVANNHKRKVWQPLTEDESISASFKRGETNDILCLENKSPKWNDRNSSPF